MHLYFNKEGKLTTVIPHGEVARQGSYLNLYVLLDEDFFESREESYLDWNVNVQLLFPDGKLSTDYVTSVAPELEVFHKTSDSEVTFDLIDGESYLTYKFNFTPAQATDVAGKIKALVSLYKTTNELTKRHTAKNIQTTNAEYFGEAEIYIEKTFGYSKKPEIQSTAHYKNLKELFNNLDARKMNREDVLKAIEDGSIDEEEALRLIEEYSVDVETLDIGTSEKYDANREDQIPTSKAVEEHFIKKEGDTINGPLYMNTDNPYLISKNKKIGIKSIDKAGKEYEIRVSSQGAQYKDGNDVYNLAMKEDVMEIVENNAEQTSTINIGTSNKYNINSDNEIPTTKAVKRIVNSSSNSNPIIKITYDELKALRDNAQLIAGQQYRIIDYDCTTTQENTASAMHPFDIIVTADDEKTLNENARACLSERDNNYFRQKYEIPAEIIEAQFKEGIEYSNIDTQYMISIDVNSYEVNDDTVDGGANVGRNDYIAEIGYAENNEGNEVPVFWKNDPDHIDEGVDYQDTYYYVGQEEFEGVVYDKWRKIESGDFNWDGHKQIYILTNVVVDVVLGESKEVYLENNLQSWEIKYSLDNDNTKYVWACDGLQIYTDDSIWFKYVGEIEVNGEKYYAWENKEQFDTNNYLLSKTLDLKLDDSLDKYDYVNDGVEEGYSAVASSVEGLDYYIQKGKGVVYYMKDDKGNECGYDFKNIIYDNNAVLYYTFNKDGKLMDLSLTDISGEYLCTDNIIKPFREEGLFYWLNSTIFNGTGFYTNILDYQNNDNFFSGYCVGNTMNVEFGGNIIGTEVSYNTFATRTFNCEFEGYIFCQQFPSNIDGEFYGEGYTGSIIDDIASKIEEQITLTTALNLKHIPKDYINDNTQAYELPLYNVETIGDSNFNRMVYLKKVYFGNNIKKIGNVCFTQNNKSFDLHLSNIDHWCGVDCDDSIMEGVNRLYTNNSLLVRNLRFTKNVKEIKENTFSYCPVTHIYIPPSVESIGAKSFYDTYAKSVTIGRLTRNNSRNDALVFCDYSSYYSPFGGNNGPIEKITIISDSPRLVGIIQDAYVETIIVRNPIENLQDKFAIDCKRLKNIYLPKSIKTIGAMAFDSLENIYYEGTQEEWEQVIVGENNSTITNSIATIHYNSYIGTDGITYKTSSDGTYMIADITEAIDGYVVVPKIVDGLEVKEVRGKSSHSTEQLYGKSFITHIILPDSIEKIGDYLGRDCISLEYINIEQLPNLKSLDTSSLSYIKVKEFIVPDKITDLNANAIFSYSSIEKINLNNVEMAGGGAAPLSWMPNLKTVIMPKLIEINNSSFFYGADKLEYIEADSLECLRWYNGQYKNFKTLIIRTQKVCELYSDSLNLDNCPNLYVYVPDELVEEYKVATNWVVLADRIKPLSEYVEEQTND